MGRYSAVLAVCVLLAGCSAADSNSPAGTSAGQSMSYQPAGPARQAARPFAAPSVAEMQSSLANGYPAALLSSLSDSDRAAIARASQRAYAAPVGQTISWTNNVSGKFGAFTPTHDGYSVNGAYCRDFRETIGAAALSQQLSGHACQQADGNWQVAR